MNQIKADIDWNFVSALFTIYIYIYIVYVLCILYNRSIVIYTDSQNIK